MGGAHRLSHYARTRWPNSTPSVSQIARDVAEYGGGVQGRDPKERTVGKKNPHTQVGPEGPTLLPEPIEAPRHTTEQAKH